MHIKFTKDGVVTASGFSYAIKCTGCNDINIPLMSWSKCQSSIGPSICLECFKKLEDFKNELLNMDGQI